MTGQKEVNLFSDDVVIIIGAGASVPFGLPTGLEMIDLISKQLFAEERCLKTGNYNRADIPLTGSFGLSPCDPVSSKWISGQCSDSIDDLIRHNSNYSIALKQCIALEIFKSIYRLEERLIDYGQKSKTYLVRDFSERKIRLIVGGREIVKANGEPVFLRNWTHNFINIIRNQIVAGFSKDGRKIKIVSFNYDGILELVLDRMWADSELINEDWTNYIKIVHPHGLIPIHKMEVNPWEVERIIVDQAKEISVIHDEDTNLPNRVLEWRTDTLKFMANARKVFSLGFAFARSNCERILGIDELWAKGDKEIHYLNFDGNSGLDARLQRFEGGFGSLPAEKYDHGSHLYPMKPPKGDYLQITDALMGGFLGEMPS